MVCARDKTQKKSRVKGKTINSTAHRTKIDAETEIFEFRYSNESKENRKKIIDRTQESKLKECAP